MLASWLGGCDAAWPPLPPPQPVTFTSTASLKVAVQAYNFDPVAATATYGLIADWDVSAVSDMSGLFFGLYDFNADISSWNTSGVTDMSFMFHVRSTRPLPQAFTTRQ